MQAMNKIDTVLVHFINIYAEQNSSTARDKLAITLKTN